MEAHNWVMNSTSENIGSAAWAREIAQRICRENNWPFLEPVRLRKGWFTWTILTNADAIGTNVVVTVKPDGKIIKVNFRAR